MSLEPIKPSELLIRPMAIDELNFVLASWKAACVDTWGYAKSVRSDIFWDRWDIRIKQFMERQGSMVLVASFREVPDLALGFIATEKQKTGDMILHYIYVKPQYRLTSIARNMIDASGIDLNVAVITHKNDRLVNDVVYKRYPGITYMPDIFIGGE